MKSTENSITPLKNKGQNINQIYINWWINRKNISGKKRSDARNEKLFSRITQGK
jgi:hypothetical protein